MQHVFQNEVVLKFRREDGGLRLCTRLTVLGPIRGLTLRGSALRMKEALAILIPDSIALSSNPG